jgi:hypothetical protein
MLKLMQQALSYALKQLSSGHDKSQEKRPFVWISDSLDSASAPRGGRSISQLPTFPDWDTAKLLVSGTLLRTGLCLPKKKIHRTEPKNRESVSCSKKEAANLAASY